MSELPPYIVPHSQEAIRILHEDHDLLLVRKPDLLLSIPGRHPLNKDCLITRLQADYPTATIVHRLDLDTSGIMVIPLNKPTHAHISRQFQERKVEKSYISVVHGIVENDEGEVELPIRCDWERRPLQMIDHERGKHALTRYRVLERQGDRTRMLLMPVTGRSHQLRIHMRELGHPILGCDMYAHEEALKMADRLLLHATTLGFEHPATGEWLEGECQPDF
ncbi:RNA pseudouridine synthase [Halioglobus japonicus]|uniref:RNA pseudouridine synthase n=1 Tax=Halioglobus japonicus TaxID=930805 RepID=A0AAP8MGW5_9GAMM|nr:pseudouridine synthase [Halioglobus japonicus]PLW87613.1 RNA pseudouridine synthase [Halioglobus japonicus]GHD07540.1 RNA pseudouridine synthase [Halioglobus japonicus]